MDRSGKRRGFRSALWPTDARKRIGLRDEAKALGDTHLQNVGGGVRACAAPEAVAPLVFQIAPKAGDMVEHQ